MLAQPPNLANRKWYFSAFLTFFLAFKKPQRKLGKKKIS